jgi:predicted MPP superfamily phosphohydrolase
VGRGALRLRLAAGLTTVLLVVWALAIEPLRLVVVTYEVEVPGLRRPVRALLVGDPQPSWPWWTRERMHETMLRGDALAPDIVFFLGDYAYEHKTMARLGLSWLTFLPPADTVEAMALVRAPLGAWAVMGNHDYYWNGPEVVRLLDHSPIRLLRDASALVSDDDGPLLHVVGLEDVTTHTIDLKRAFSDVDDRAPSVVLSHSPEVLPRLPPRARTLFAAHTHGGQIALPGVGPIVLPIRDRALARGRIVRGGRTVVVTSGLGLSILPLRFGVPPELAVVTLSPAPLPPGPTR